MTKQLSKKNDLKRKWRSFTRHSLILLEPLIVSGLVTGGWIYLRSNGYHLSHEDGETLSVAIVNTLAIIFSLIAAVVLATVWDNYRKIVIAVLREDKESFLLYRDERIPTLMYLLLGAFSLPLILVIGLLEWRHLWSGIIGVSSVSFAVSLVWSVAFELQHPQKSPWVAERVPSEWFDIDIDDRFKESEKE